MNENGRPATRRNVKEQDKSLDRKRSEIKEDWAKEIDKLGGASRDYVREIKMKYCHTRPARDIVRSSTAGDGVLMSS